MERLQVGGVPAFYEEGPEPAMASLIFRVGVCDEDGPRRGITHLVEHLALYGIGRRDHLTNGFVALSTCTFYAQGTQDEIERFLGDVTRSLGGLPLDRLEPEKRVLQREASLGGGGVVDRLMSHRFGARAYGGGDVVELGLRWLGPDEVRAWAQERFTAANAALWIHAPRPPALAPFELPQGQRHPPPPVVPLARRELPVFAEDGQGAVAAGFMTDRSWAATIGAGLARERLHDRLRLGEALAYEAWLSYAPLTREHAHAALGSDCDDHEAPKVAQLLLEVFDELAENGPVADELDRAKRMAERAYVDVPDAERRDLDRAAFEELLGGSYTDRDYEIDELRALTADQVQALFRRAREELVLLAPLDTPKPRDALATLDRPPVEIPGRQFKAKALRQQNELTIGEVGISLRMPEETIAIPADEVAVVIEADEDKLTVVSVDSSWIEVTPHELRDSDDVKAAVAELSPGPFVPSDDMRPRWVRTLAEKKLARKWTLSEELSLLPGVLDPEEEPLTMAEAARGRRLGLLVVTEQRLLWLFAGLRKEEFLRLSRESIRSAQVKRRLTGSKVLKIELEDEEIDFDDFKPKTGMDEIAWTLNGDPPEKAEAGL